MDYSLPGSFVQGIVQARILKWSDYTRKPQSSRQYATGTKTEI